MHFSSKTFLSLLSISLLIIFIACEITIRNLSKKIPFLDAVRSAKSGEVECLIMGDSHTQKAFLAEIPNCSNFSLGGASIPMFKDVISSVEQSNPLKTVIIGIAPHYFAEYRSKTYQDVLIGIAGSPHMPMFFSQINRDHFKWYFLGKFNALVSNLFHNSSLGTNGARAITEKEIDERLEYQADIKNIDSHQYKKILEKIIIDLRDKNIKVFFVRTPVLKYYDKKLFELFSYDEWKQEMAVLEKLGAVYIDFTQIEFDSSKNIYFIDQEHLSEIGSEAFSKKISSLYTFGS